MCYSFVTPWTVDCQAPLSMGFCRQEYWSGLPFPTPGYLPNPGIDQCLLQLLHWQADSWPQAPPQCSGKRVYPLQDMGPWGGNSWKQSPWSQKKREKWGEVASIIRAQSSAGLLNTTATTAATTYASLSKNADPQGYSEKHSQNPHSTAKGNSNSTYMRGREAEERGDTCIHIADSQVFYSRN